MTTKTFRLSKKRMDRSWHVRDATDVPLGRLASEAAKLLLGKHKPTYEPHLAMGDFVVIVNAAEVGVTGHKAANKVYYRHSGYPGGLRERTLAQQMERDPRRVIESAVKGMLPHNSRGRELLRHLKVYAGPDHPHEAQVMAGTGARAKKRAAREQAVAAREAVAAPARRRRAVTAAEPGADEAAGAAEVAVAEEAEQAEEAVQAESAPSEPATEAPQRRRSLSRMTRAQLDEEATGLGIDIDSQWQKADVVTAIEQHRATADADEQESQDG